MRRYKRKRSNNSPKAFIIIVVCLMLFMTSGYAILTQNIQITGTATSPQQIKLDNRLNIYSTPWYSQIVTAHAYLTRSTENLTNGNVLTTNFNRVSKNTTATLALRLTYTNILNYTLTTGTITNTKTCTGTVSSNTISTTSLAKDATVTINVAMSINTRNNSNCNFNFTIKYAYAGINKYLYYTVHINA